MSGDAFEDLTSQWLLTQTGQQVQSGAAPYWYDYPQAWDSVFLKATSGAVILVPGVCDVELKAGYKLDKKKVPGANGGTITFKGQDFTEIKITVTFWTADHLTKIGTLMQAIKPTPEKTLPSPFIMFHALTNMYGIQAICVEKIEGPHPSSKVKGAKQLVLTCLEYLPAQNNATTTVKENIPPFANAKQVATGPQAPKKPSTLASKPRS